MSIGESIFWRFKGEKEFRRNDVLEINGDLLFLGHEELRRNYSFLQVPSAWDWDMLWVKRSEIEIQGEGSK